MITSFFLNIIYVVLNFAIQVLPLSSGLPSQVTDAVNFVLGLLSQWTFILPLATLFTILSYTLLIEFALWSFHGAMWVYKKVRGA